MGLDDQPYQTPSADDEEPNLDALHRRFAFFVSRKPFRRLTGLVVPRWKRGWNDRAMPSGLFRVRGVRTMATTTPTGGQPQTTMQGSGLFSSLCPPFDPEDDRLDAVGSSEQQ